MNPRGQVAPQTQLRRVPTTPPCCLAHGQVTPQAQFEESANDRACTRLQLWSPINLVHFNALFLRRPLFWTSFFLKTPSKSNRNRQKGVCRKDGQQDHKKDRSQNLADLKMCPALLLGNLDAVTAPESLQIRVRKPTLQIS